VNAGCVKHNRFALAFEQRSKQRHGPRRRFAATKFHHLMDSEHASPIRDPKRIDLDNPAEVAVWCTLLTLSEADLRTAVGIIGPMSAAVAVYVNSRGRRGAARQVGEIGHPFERRVEPRVVEERNTETREGDPIVKPSVPAEGK